MRKATLVLQEKEGRTTDEDELINKAQKNPALFQDIYMLWVTPIYQYIYAHIGTSQDAEDLTSQTFLKAYHAFPHYRHKGHFSAWLFTIARNQVRGFFRRKTAAKEAFLKVANQATTNHDLLYTIAHADEIDHLKHLIQSLPDEEQELIRLRYVAELKFGDIAIVLGRKEDAVKKTLYRLQDKLKRLLEEDNE